MRHLFASALFFLLFFSGTTAHALGGAKVPAKLDYRAIKARKPSGAQLDALLKEPYQTELLKYSKSHHNAESLLFLLDVAGGKDKKAIYNRYIDPNGSAPVNIPNRVKAPLDAQAAAKKWERLDFSEAVKEIRGLSINEISTPFLNTK